MSVGTIKSRDELKPSDGGEGRQTEGLWKRVTDEVDPTMYSKSITFHREGQGDRTMCVQENTINVSNDTTSCGEDFAERLQHIHNVETEKEVKRLQLLLDDTQCILDNKLEEIDRLKETTNVTAYQAYIEGYNDGKAGQHIRHMEHVVIQGTVQSKYKR